MDCQTQKEIMSCEYCIIKERCHLHLELECKIGVEDDHQKLLGPLLTLEVPVCG
jgi:hypothetical protein